MTALSCIPASSITVYRGVKKDLAGKFVRGESVTFWSVTSTTFNVEVLQEEMFLGKVGDRTMFTIAAKTVRDIQPYSAMGLTESEFISLPGTSYDVQGVLDQGALKIVQLEENVAECMLDFEPDVQAYAALEAGSTVAPALSSPSTATPAPFPAPVVSGGSATMSPPAAPAAAAALSLSLLSPPDVALIVAPRAPITKATPPPLRAAASEETSSTRWI